MRLLSDGEVLATDVDVVESTFAQARGLMFRRSIPDDYALVFPFDAVDQRSVHMVFVPFPLTVVWLVDGRVEQVKRLSPWTGLGRERADMLIELPAARAEAIEVGDELRLDDST